MLWIQRARRCQALKGSMINNAVLYPLDSRIQLPTPPARLQIVQHEHSHPSLQENPSCVWGTIEFGQEYHQTRGRDHQPNLPNPGTTLSTATRVWNPNKEISCNSVSHWTCVLFHRGILFARENPMLVDLPQHSFFRIEDTRDTGANWRELFSTHVVTLTNALMIVPFGFRERGHDIDCGIDLGSLQSSFSTSNNSGVCYM